VAVTTLLLAAKRRRLFRIGGILQHLRRVGPEPLARLTHVGGLLRQASLLRMMARFVSSCRASTAAAGLGGRRVEPGIVCGPTDDFSYKIVEKPVNSHDLSATILHCLGIDHPRRACKSLRLDAPNQCGRALAANGHPDVKSTPASERHEGIGRPSPRPAK